MGCPSAATGIWLSRVATHHQFLARQEMASGECETKAWRQAKKPPGQLPPPWHHNDRPVLCYGFEGRRRETRRRDRACTLPKLALNLRRRRLQDPAELSATYDRRIHRTRAQDAHADAEESRLHAQGGGKADHGELGRAVTEKPGNRN